jgi:hypothetical protein
MRCRFPWTPISTPELMAVIEGQKVRRRPDCPFILHGRSWGKARLDENGSLKPTVLATILRTPSDDGSAETDARRSALQQIPL